MTIIKNERIKEKTEKITNDRKKKINVKMGLDWQVND